jgi:virulence factor Mce-like protein
VTASVLRRRASGVAFLVIVGLLVWLTVLLYQKAFTDTVTVTLKTDRIGNQLSAHSDVKIRGLVVGEVRDISSDGTGATVQLALHPSDAGKIDKQAVAQLLPKTLFGEKEVVLVNPPSPSGQTLQHGGTIDQDHSVTARETETALNDLLPLLKALKPQDLSTALNALSTALRDRGDKLGANLARTGAYFAQLNPSLPTLQQDMAGLADFANNTADATPNLLKVLDNLSASSRNLVEERASLDSFLTSTTSFASTAEAVLRHNEQSLVQLAAASRVPLALYAKYSPEFPCFFAGLTSYGPIVEKTFGGAQGGLHITVEATSNNNGFGTDDRPEYADTRGPYCDNLPHPKVPASDTEFADGYDDNAQTPSSATALDQVVAPLLGVTPQQVPDIARLLLEPVAAGQAVGLS